jgi:urease accessory protein
MNMGRRLPLGLAWSVLLIWPASVLAHTGDSAGGFVTGLSHPVSGLDHVLAMVAVGMWGAQLGKPALWLLPIAFPMVMALGAMLGLMGIPVPGVELGIAISALVLGIMVLTSARPPLAVALILVGFFAVFHGNAHGTELPAGESGLLYSIGFVIATGLLHAVGITIGLIQHWPKGKLALRAGGAVVAGFGCFFILEAVT